MAGMDDYRMSYKGQPTSPTTDYTQFLGDIKTSGTQAGAQTGNPYIAGAGVVSDLIGTGVNLYGTIAGNNQAEDEYKLALKQYEDEKKRAAEIDRINMEQMQLGNTMTFGDYANKMRTQDAGTGQYYSNIGR